ncbi:MULTISPECIES: DUF6190 family protein [unclassified Nocardiopsis]|uniref:DUF6190 family protein n=1 Tax=unclassified Nocardiopsis TaxID=2649073 RepID=UPI0019153B23|nr:MULTISPECIES: DUF6190 family protein [unclassified Nocardiopsis]
MTADVFVDADVFMGMHHENEALRRGCKAFFVERLKGRVAMSLEQVGRCDDLVWRRPRELQDAYYPFMDPAAHRHGGQPRRATPSRTSAGHGRTPF